MAGSKVSWREVNSDQQIILHLEKLHKVCNFFPFQTAITLLGRCLTIRRPSMWTEAKMSPVSPRLWDADQLPSQLRRVPDPEPRPRRSERRAGQFLGQRGGKYDWRRGGQFDCYRKRRRDARQRRLSHSQRLHGPEQYDSQLVGPADGVRNHRLHGDHIRSLLQRWTPRHSQDPQRRP